MRINSVQHLSLPEKVTIQVTRDLFWREKFNFGWSVMVNSILKIFIQLLGGLVVPEQFGWISNNLCQFINPGTARVKHGIAISNSSPSVVVIRYVPCIVPTGDLSWDPLVYSYSSSGAKTGWSPTTPSPRTSLMSPLLSVMTQCRRRSCTVLWLKFFKRIR